MLIFTHFSTNSFARVDEGSIAEKSGIKVGDQILDANGKSFENILHKDAVEFFKSNKDVLLTVKVVIMIHFFFPKIYQYFSHNIPPGC